MQTGNIIANSTSNGNTVVSTLLLNNSTGAIQDYGRMYNVATIGNVTTVSSNSPFGKVPGQSSISFNGLSNYLQVQGNTAVTSIGPVAFTGNFTIETWINCANISSPATQTIVDTRPQGTSAFTSGYCNLYLSSGTLTFNNPSGTYSAGVGFSSNSWTHIALSRANGITKMFINGSQVGATIPDTNTYIQANARPVIGVDGNALTTNYFNGNIADFRISSNVARYTSNFVPPVGPLPTL
jgi:hypothetical protein